MSSQIVMPMGTFITNNQSRKEHERLQNMHEKKLARAKPVLTTRDLLHPKQKLFDPNRMATATRPDRQRQADVVKNDPIWNGTNCDLLAETLT